MPLPNDFSEWIHLRHSIKKVHNDAVRKFYSNQPDDDISTPRASAKHACLMKDEDTSTMTVLRFWLFWVVCRKMRDNFEPYPYSPIVHDAIEVKYKPQITCFFLQDVQDIEVGRSPVEGQLSIRVMEETSDTLTKVDLEYLANKINFVFGQGNGYVWKKGKQLYSYRDLPNGHRFRVLARNQSDATEIIQKLLSIDNKNFNPEILTRTEDINPDSSFSDAPSTVTILGKTYGKPRRRPVANVRFIYASIKVWGLPKPIVLVDKTGYWSKAIISS